MWSAGRPPGQRHPRQSPPVISGPAPEQGPNGTRAKAAQAGHNSVLENLGKFRTIPREILGARELVGQVLATTNGRKFRVTGLDVLLPDTADTYAARKRYGAAPDATAVARCPEPLRREPPRPWEGPAAPLATFVRPTGTPAPP